MYLSLSLLRRYPGDARRKSNAIIACGVFCILSEGLNRLLRSLAHPYRGSDCRSAVGRLLLVCRTGSGTAGRFSRQGVPEGHPYQCDGRSSIGSRKSHPGAAGCKWHPADSAPEEKTLENLLLVYDVSNVSFIHYLQKHFAV